MDTRLRGVWPPMKTNQQAIRQARSFIEQHGEKPLYAQTNRLQQPGTPTRRLA